MGWGILASSWGSLQLWGSGKLRGSAWCNRASAIHVALHSAVLCIGRMCLREEEHVAVKGMCHDMGSAVPASQKLDSSVLEQLCTCGQTPFPLAYTTTLRPLQCMPSHTFSQPVQTDQLAHLWPCTYQPPSPDPVCKIMPKWVLLHIQTWRHRHAHVNVQPQCMLPWTPSVMYTLVSHTPESHTTHPCLCLTLTVLSLITPNWLATLPVCLPSTDLCIASSYCSIQSVAVAFSFPPSASHSGAVQETSWNAGVPLGL